VNSLDAEAVLLFSGGIDSFGGAVQSTICDKRKVALVSHRSAPKRIPALSYLATELDRRADQKVHHIPVWATKAEQLGREHTQRTRSFLYASLAAAVARMLGLDMIHFYENGVTSLNLPIAPQLVGGRATRTTHPQSLNSFAKLFSILFDQPFHVVSPFLWLTKAEVLRVIKEHGCTDLIKHTVSCSRIVEATKLETHCGRCSQCIDRRFGTLAAGLTDDEDPSEMYKIQLMTDPRVVGETRTMAEAFLRQALAIRTMDELEFFKAYPEATRGFRHVGLPSHEAARRIHDLYRRHGEEVNTALTEGHRQHAAEFQAGTLPDSCVLVLSVPNRYRHRDVAQKVPTFRRKGDFWEVWFENEETTLKDSVGTRYIALLLNNPGRRTHVVDMQLAEAVLSGKVDSSSLPTYVGDPNEVGIKIRQTPASSGGPTVDCKAVPNYRVRLDQIEEELNTAQAAGNPTAASELKEEADRINRHIRSIINLRGRPRPSAADDERARGAVRKAIRRTINQLWKKHPYLARHLAKHLTMGFTCLYDPDPPVTWATK